MHLQKYLVLLLFVTSFGYNLQSFAQNNEQDTIQQSFDQEAFKASLKELKPNKFAALFNQQYKDDSIRGIISVKHAENNMLTSGDLRTQFWGYYCLAKWYNLKTNFKESIVYANKATEIAKQINDSNLLLNNYMFQGNFYYDYGKYKESMESYLNAIKYGKEIKYIGRKLAISKNIALLKIEVGDYKGAIDLLEGTLKIVEEEHKGKFKILLVSIYIALAKSCMKAEEYEKAEYYGSKGIELSNQYGDEDAKAYLYNFLGETNILKANYIKALSFLRKAKEKASEIESAKAQLPFINLNLAKVYYHNGDFRKAIKILEEIEINQRQRNTNFFSLEDMYKFLGKSYKAIGNTEKSLYYFEKTNEVYTENDKKQNAIGIEIIKKYDLAELKEELDTAQATSKNKSVWLSTSIVLIVLLLISFGFIYRNREKQNKKKFEKLVATSTTTLEAVKPIKVIAENDKNYISDAIATDVLQKLKKFEDKELYLQKNSTLADVASKLNTNPTYLSKTVNKHKGKSFSNYIKELRVQYVIDRLKSDKKFRLYTIEAIAKEVGYIRAEPFSKSFKSKTGLYPSYFIKQLNTQEV